MKEHLRIRGDNTQRSLAPRCGFTLTELLVVIAVIGLLVGLLLPAVQQARELARRMQCGNNLSQLIIAMNHYESAHGVFPPGTIDTQGPVLNARLGYHHNWLVQLLPYLEMHNVSQAVHVNQSIYHAKNAVVRKHGIPLLLCPSQASGSPMTHYAACHHDVEAPIDAQDHGVFFLNSRLRYRDITDGSSCTIFLGEKLTDAWDMEWCSGTRGTLRNTGSTINKLTQRNLGLPGGSTGYPYDGLPYAPGAPGMSSDPLDVPGLESGKQTVEPSTAIQGVKSPAGQGQPATLGSPSFVGGFGSEHYGGAMFAFGDGNVRYLNQTIDATVLQQLGHRADGKLLPEF